tara:strand:+ start:492 stop:2210 length:1719 start_codon:yes stop_codon:yes gene_type:complete
MNKIIFSLLDKNKKFQLKIMFILISVYFFFEFASLASIPIFVGILASPDLVINKIENFLNLSLVGKYTISQFQIFAALLVILIFLIKNIYLILITIYESKFLKNFKIYISNKLFNYYTKLPYHYHLKNNPSKLTKIVSDDVQNASGYIQHTLTLTREVIAMTVIFVLLLIVNWVLALTIFLLLILVSSIYLKIIKPFLKRTAKKNHFIRKSMFQTISEVFGIIKEVKVYSKENQIIKFYNKNNAEFEKNLYYFYIISKLPRVILEIFALSLIILVSLIFFNISDDYTKHFPTLALLTAATVRFIPAFNGIVSGLSYLKIFSVSIDLISKEINDMKNYEIEELGKKTIFKREKLKKEGYLQLNNLSFKYHSQDQYLLKNINLNIDKGSKIAIIGETGSGKSTLANLVLGLFTPQEGDIFFEGESIYNNIGKWRKRIGYVPQKTYLLDSSIEKNITFDFFESEIDYKKMEKAIYLSCLSEKIKELPNGLKTRVGADGLKFSGGEKQRMALARAIYHDHTILVMDEFTSALDQTTENKILSNLSDFLKEKTCIIVSHRSNTIKECNKILNLSDTN